MKLGDVKELTKKRYSSESKVLFFHQTKTDEKKSIIIYILA